MQLCSASYLHADLIEPLRHVHQLLLDLFAGPLGCLQASSQLLHLSLHQAHTPLLEAVLLPQLVMQSGVLVHLNLQILDETREINAVSFSNYSTYFMLRQIKLLL